MIQGVDIMLLKGVEDLALKFLQDGYIIQLEYNITKNGCLIDQCQYFFEMKILSEFTERCNNNIVFCFMSKSCFSDPMNLLNKKMLYQEFSNNFIKKDSFIKYNGDSSTNVNTDANAKECEIQKFHKISTMLYPKNYSPFMKYNPNTIKNMKIYINNVLKSHENNLLKPSPNFTHKKITQGNSSRNAKKIHSEGRKTKNTLQKVKKIPTPNIKTTTQKKENLKLKELLCDIFD